MFEMLYGRNAVHEALRAGRRRCQSLLLAKGVRESDTISDILRLAAERRIPVRQVDRRQLDELGPVNHQGIAAQVGVYPYAEVEAMLDLARQRNEPALLLLLDCLQDPQNLGTLLRTADAVEVHGVVIPRHRAADITPAVSNSSAGAVEHLLIAQVTNLVRVMEALKQEGIWIVGLENLPEAQDYHRTDLKMPLALVVGSEGYGLSRLVREHCDLWIKLPIRGHIGSLNAAVAGSVALYEVWRQRGQPIGTASHEGP